MFFFPDQYHKELKGSKRDRTLRVFISYGKTKVKYNSHGKKYFYKDKIEFTLGNFIYYLNGGFEKIPENEICLYSIRYKDGNPRNNRFENLIMVRKSEYAKEFFRENPDVKQEVVKKFKKMIATERYTDLKVKIIKMFKKGVNRSKIWINIDKKINIKTVSRIINDYFEEEKQEVKNIKEKILKNFINFYKEKGYIPKGYELGENNFNILLNYFGSYKSFLIENNILSNKTYNKLYKNRKIKT